MSSLVVVGRQGRPLLRLTTARALTGLALFLPMGGAVLALLLAAPGTWLWPAFLLALAVGWAVALPDGLGGLVAVVGYGLWWVDAVRDPTTPWALLAAASVLAFHAALAQASAAPWGCPVEATVLVRLGRDLLAVLTVTAGVAWLATSAGGWFDAPVLLVAATLGLVGVLPWLSDARARLPRRTGPPRRTPPEDATPRW